jgi:hypothetical protein
VSLPDDDRAGVGTWSDPSSPTMSHENRSSPTVMEKQNWAKMPPESSASVRRLRRSGHDAASGTPTLIGFSTKNMATLIQGRQSGSLHTMGAVAMLITSQFPAPIRLCQSS